MIHPATELVLISEVVGRGVRATATIEAGTFLWVLDRFDAVLSPREVSALSDAEREVASFWGYRDHKGQTIVCSDLGRFVNHSCEPAMRGVGPDAMIAVRDVEPGDELTCDYAECNLEEPMPCACGSERCRGEISVGDIGRHGAAWQAEVLDALARGRELPQPILKYALEPRTLAGILVGEIACPSIADVELAE